MRSEVKRGDHAIEFDTEERCAIREVANDAGDEQVSIALARVKPGVTTAWHKLRGITERYIIVQGEGRVQVGDQPPAAVRPGDVVRIAADTPQRIANTGREDLLFYAVCAPRFQAACYVHMERIRP